jgi:hypothetical protein
MQRAPRSQSAPAQRRWLGRWLYLLGLFLLPPLWGLEYQDHRPLSAALNQLAAEHADIVRVTRQAVTLGTREVWLVELGSGSESERKQRPAMLVIAGVEGNDLVGSVSVFHWMSDLARRYSTDSAARSLLDTTTLYVFPRVNPDAAESFFAKPRVERTTNDTPTDDDHDGKLDEDGPEDLNGDGLISSMRVEDPEGEYVLDPAEPRLLVKADRAKGEKGAWKLLSEGVDNDKDEQWNEDGRGGVNLNRNFPYHYEFFAPWAGWHQVSEVETRALADFIATHPNIGIAFTFGAADNLVQAPKSEPGGKRPPAAISDADAPYYRELGQKYRDDLGLKKELTATSEPGTVSDWIYFHRGRLSLAAKPWTPQLQIELAKAAKPDEAKKKESAGDKKDDEADSKSQDKDTKAKPQTSGKEEKPSDKKTAAEKRGEEDRATLKWFDENAPEGVLPWKEFKHPDFPDKKVEIGGWAPFAQNNPPVRLLEEWAQRHARFLTELAGKLPHIGLRKATATHLGSGVYELRLEIENTGYLPTALAQGALTREVLRTRVVLNLEPNQILAGEKTTLLGPINGSGGMHELRYVIHAKGTLDIEVIAALGGTVRRTIELKETP